jgi:hydrogenase expression/formation protein HypC
MCLAIPGKLLTVEDHFITRVGSVEFGGITRQANLDFVPEARVGDYVLVHVGFAISRIDEAEALRTLEILREMGELSEVEDGPAST